MHIYVYILWGVIALLIPLTAHAQSHGETQEAHAQLQFYDEGQQKFINAPGVATDIQIDIQGTVARTSVVQYFANDIDDWQEGIYMYPLPEDSAVDKLVMIVGDERILGFVAQKEKARKIYEKAKADGKSAGLLEQHRPNIFKTSVANIPPQSLVAVEISYQHEVAIDGADFTLRMPLAITPRYDHFNLEDCLQLASAKPEGSFSHDLVDRLALNNFTDGENPVRLQVSMNAGFKAQNLKSSHKIAIEGSESGTHQISLQDEFIPGEQDFVLSWENPNPQESISFAHTEKLEDAYYTHIMLVPPQIIAQQGDTPKRQITFIIDTSGSMDGPSIRQAKAALKEALADLHPNDVFNVIQFNSETEALYDQSVSASPAHIQKAIGWVNQLQATGGTEMLQAVKIALSEPDRDGYLPQIVFITDGAIGYENDLGAYIKEHVGQKRFYAVGIGSAPNAYLMRMFAEIGRGHATFISDINQTQNIMRDLFAKMKAPVFQDIKMDIAEGAGVFEIVPEKLPDLMLGQSISAVIKSQNPIDRIHLYAEANEEEWFQDLSTNKPVDGGNKISKLYARRKIAALNFDDPARKNPATEAQITDLGISHQIVSAYTSLVAVGEERLRPKIATVATHRYNPNLPKGWQLAHYNPADAAKAYEEIIFEENQNKDKDVETKNLIKHKIDLPQTDTGFVLRLLTGLVLMVLALLVGLRAKENMNYA